MIKIEKKELYSIFTILLFVASFTELPAMEQRRSKKHLSEQRAFIAKSKAKLQDKNLAAELEAYSKFYYSQISEKEELADKVELSAFEVLPCEIQERIFDYLKGNDRGLNYLVRCRYFNPTSIIADKIRAKFLLCLRDNNGILSESLAYALVNFFKTQYKGRRYNPLLLSFKSSFFLNRSIPVKVTKSWGVNDKENISHLNYSVIEGYLKSFVNGTQDDWDMLSEKIKEQISFSDYCLIRKKIIECFANRLKGYVEKKKASCCKAICDIFRTEDTKDNALCNPCPLLSGTPCCSIAVINTIVGFSVMSFSETACALLAGFGGFGCAVMGGVVCCIVYDPKWERCACYQVIHKNPTEYCSCYRNCCKNFENKIYKYKPKRYYKLKNLFNDKANLQLEKEEVLRPSCGSVELKECLICKDFILEDDIQLPCNHNQFHRECLEQLKETNNNCPVCRCDL